jgi:hypothetical protein
MAVAPQLGNDEAPKIEALLFSRGVSTARQSLVMGYEAVFLILGRRSSYK